MSLQFALTYAPNVYSADGLIMGRQSAGNGFLRAALAAKPERLWCYTSSRQAAEKFGQEVRQMTGVPPELRFIAFDQTERLERAGILYRPDPGILEDAWHRHHVRKSQAYSLCGVTHTLSSHGAMTALTTTVSAPLYPWDAIICTSNVVKVAVSRLFEAQADRLREWHGATRFPRPQLPIIPLGVHADDFLFSNQQRADARAKLGLGEDGVAVLFVGRLVFHAKGHPYPMFAALEQAAKRCKQRVHLVLCGQFPNRAIEKAFRAEAAVFAPSVNLITLDGGKASDRELGWAGADIFTSFSDNIQETFGLTPIEAMAAGLPVVVSDWNGYKDTVRDGVDGFRIPTWVIPRGLGGSIAERYDKRLDDYDGYIGSASQFVAIDVAKAADAFARLIESQPLRQELGSAGRARAKSVFDWSVVFEQYIELWRELAVIRQAGTPVEIFSRRPDRLDPFDLFGSFTTHTIYKRTIVEAILSVDEMRTRRNLSSVAFAASILPSDAVLSSILTALDQGRLSVGSVLEKCSNIPLAAVIRGLVWMAKMGIVSFVPEM